MTKLDKALAVKIYGRQEHGEYVAYTALSSDGETEYTVTLHRFGKATGCTCPSTCGCKHRLAAEVAEEFEDAWENGIHNATCPCNACQKAAAVALEHKIDQDMVVHVEDDLAMQKRAPKPVKIDEEREKRMRAPLNGNRGFQLLA